jgi:hypothetical protein
MAINGALSPRDGKFPGHLFGISGSRLGSILQGGGFMHEGGGVVGAKAVLTFI